MHQQDIFLISNRVLHGDSSRSPFDYCKSSPDNMDSGGVHKESRWSPHGVPMEYMEYTRSPHGIYGVYKESMRSPGGVRVEYMEYTRSLQGVHRESTRTWWTPHGLHSYLWGS